jgi:hypothetical protein
MHRDLGRRPVAQLLRLRGYMLVGCDEVVLQHAVDDVLLALGGTLRIDDRVVRGRRLGQAGEHRRFSDGQVLQRLAEVDLARGREAVRALAEEDLVHVDLEDLLLAQHALDLERQQHLVDLAREGLLGRQVEVARHLHRDRRGALAARIAELRQAGAQHALVVDAAVFVEARVLDREHGVLHDLRDLGDRREVASLLAELAEQHAVGGVDPHRQLRPVVRQAADLGQVRVGDRQRDRDEHQAGDRTGGNHADERGDRTQRPASPRGQRCAEGRPPRCGLRRFAPGFTHETSIAFGRL